MKRWLSLLPFLVLVVGGGLALGWLTAPGDWYDGLAKPSFNPPGWVFGPVWGVLYVLIAIAGWLVWRKMPRSTLMGLWWAQLVLNFAWSPAFFALHQIGLALAIVLALLGTIVAFIALAWRRVPLAAGLFVPYAAWVAFASTLNGAIWMLN